MTKQKQLSLNSLHRRTEMAAEMEDAVTFLQRVSDQYSDVTSLLSTPQLLALDMNPKEPFQNDNVRLIYALSFDCIALNSIDYR